MDQSYAFSNKKTISVDITSSCTTSFSLQLLPNCSNGPVLLPFHEEKWANLDHFTSLTLSCIRLTKALKKHQKEKKDEQHKAGWYFLHSSIPFLFSLSGYVTGGFINHRLDSLCQGELTAFGPISRCKRQWEQHKLCLLRQEPCVASLSLPTERQKLTPTGFPGAPPLIRGFCGVPGAWQTITDIITSASIFFLRESRVSPSN